MYKNIKFTQFYEIIILDRKLALITMDCQILPRTFTAKKVWWNIYNMFVNVSWISIKNYFIKLTHIKRFQTLPNVRSYWHLTVLWRKHSVEINTRLRMYVIAFLDYTRFILYYFSLYDSNNPHKEKTTEKKSNILRLLK